MIRLNRIVSVFLALSMVCAGTCACVNSCAKPESIDLGKRKDDDKKDEEEKKKEEEEEKPVEPVKYAAVNSFNISGIDQFGRSFTTIDGYKKDHTVGMFFWCWIGQPYANEIYDATKIAAMPNGTDILYHQEYPRDENGKIISHNGQAHFWGEPLWGYYNNDDEWVIRKQMEMITLAGVDFIFFDHTNALIYSNVVLKVAKVISEMMKEGWQPPKIMSYTHTYSIQTVNALYNEIYKLKRYPETWYMVDGKPAIIAYTNVVDDRNASGSSTYNPAPLSAEILNFFHFYTPNWPTKDSRQVLPNGFPWIEWIYPQPYHPVSGVMNVTVASHPSVPFSFTITRGLENWGRGWNPYLKRNVSEDVDKGTFFQLQWDNAVKADPPVVSVGGWNEWIAYKQLYDGEYMLCDACSKEFSRDIEPMNGGYQDAFYLQLIRNIRRYKGIQNEEKPKRKPLTIDVAGEFTQWNDASFVEKKGDAKQAARDSYGASQVVRYVQPAPENALAEVRASYDADNIYIFVKTRKDITDPKSGDHTWFNLYIGEGEPQVKGWESYEYLVGNTASSQTLSIDKLGASYSLASAGECNYRKASNMMQIAIPRAKVGLSNANSFHFKVAMGVENPSNIMNTYTSGSVMPMGRLSYQFYFE